MLYDQAKHFLIERRSDSVKDFKEIFDKLFKRKAELIRHALHEYVKHLDAFFYADYDNHELKQQFKIRMETLENQNSDKSAAEISEPLPDFTHLIMSNEDVTEVFGHVLSDEYEPPKDIFEILNHLEALWIYYNVLWHPEDQIPLTIHIYFDHALTLVLERACIAETAIRKKGYDKGRTIKGKRKILISRTIEAHKELFKKHVISSEDGPFTCATKIRRYLLERWQEKEVPSMSSIQRYLKEEKITKK